jgi:membrane associated rhomboid family serine protease
MSEFRYYRPNPFPPIVKNLIIINVLVYVAQKMFESSGLTSKIGLWPIESANFRPYQVVTHMFAHAPDMIFHILFNMLVLWMFGRVLENVWGGKKFLIFYLVCGLGAAAAHLTVQYFQYKELLEAASELERLGDHFAAEQLRNLPAFAVGASGAIMGVMAAFAYLFPNTELFIMLIPIPIKAKWAVLGYVAIDLFSGISNVRGDNIAHFAHLGGALTGFILVLIWNKTNRKTFY